MGEVNWAVTLGGQLFELLLDSRGVEGFELEVRQDGEHSGSTPVFLQHVFRNKYLITLGNRSAPIFIDRTAEGYRVVLYGHEYQAQVEETRLHRLLEEVASLSGPGGPVEVRSPMPGLVVEVEVAQDDTVSEGQGIAVIESMKMENEIRAAVDGVVEKVLIEQGQTVDKGQPLIRIVPPEE